MTKYNQWGILPYEKFWFDGTFCTLLTFKDNVVIKEESDVHCGGYGIKKNVAEGLKWLIKAEQQGDAIAAYSLGGRYFYGDGVEKNVDLAATYFRKTAEMGDADAQKILGLCYEGGIVVPKDAVKAVKWYTKAAEQGEPDAQFNLAQCYMDGIGIKG